MSTRSMSYNVGRCGYTVVHLYQKTLKPLMRGIGRWTPGRVHARYRIARPDIENVSVQRAALNIAEGKAHVFYARW